MWLNKSKYLHAVTGQQIVDEQAKLHTETSYVVATQPILLKDRSEGNLPIYDAFLYYKEKWERLNGKPLCRECAVKVARLVIAEY